MKGEGGDGEDRRAGGWEGGRRVQSEGVVCAAKSNGSFLPFSFARRKEGQNPSVGPARDTRLSRLGSSRLALSHALVFN